MNSGRSLQIVLVLVASVFADRAAEAASSADPFYASHTLPAAGMIGLAVLAAIIAVAGAFVLFRKPRA